MQLLNDNKECIGVLTDYKERKIVKTLSNGDKELTFQYPVTGKFVELLREEYYIRTKSDEYVIRKRVTGSQYNEYTAQLNIEELEGKVFPNGFESKEQSIRACLEAAFENTGWKVGLCEVRKNRTISEDSETTAWNILKECLSTYRCECEIHTLTKTIDICEQVGSDRGTYFIEGLNLRKLTVTSDTYEFYTRILPYGKDGMEIEYQGKNYIENYQYSTKVKTYIWRDERYTNKESLLEDAIAKLDELSQPYLSYTADIIDLARQSDQYSEFDFSIGDTVLMVSKTANTKEKQRIVKLTEYPESPEKNTVELSNTTKTFAELQQEETEKAKAEAVQEAKNNVDKLIKDYIKTDELEAVQATIETAVITNLQAKFATIENLKAATARIETLETDSLTANSAVITQLTGGVANINTILFGSASGGSLSTEFSDSIVSMIGDAQIKSAMIKDISADKITSGKIYTNQVEIVSQSGNLDIADNTIQIKDRKKVVRVQIGKDTSGDYNIYIWDKNGKLMFDPLYGVQEDGIKKAIIRNDMISDTANISGKKIDIASLITTINEDGSSTLNASKIYIDTDHQTLDISFKSITEKTDTAVSTANSASASATTALGKAQDVVDRADRGEFKGDKGDTGAAGATGATGLKALQPTRHWTGTYTTIGQTANYTASDFNRTPVVGDTFTNLDGASNTGTWKVISANASGGAIQLLSYVSSKGAKGDTGATGATGKGLKSVTPQYYLSTSQTTQSGGSWSDTKSTWVTGRYYWTRDKMDWSDNTTTYSTPQLATDLNNLYSSLKTVTETVTTQGTNISALQGGISSKIWQQDITTAVTSLQIGGRNLYKGTKYWNGEWIVKDGVTIAEDVAKMTAAAYPYYGTVAVKSKEQYTISLEVKSDVAHTTTERGVVLLNFVDSKKQRVHASWVPGSFATEWKRINYTFNVPENDNIAALWIGLRNNSNKVVYFRYLKLEKGNKATDWTPAPEDVDSSISALEGTTETLNTKYTTLDQTLTSLTTTVNNNTTAISKKADGSTVTTLQENFTKFKQDSDTFQTSVSKTYATKTEMSSKSDKIVATFSGNGSSNPYCLLAELKISGGYVNTPIVIAIDQRSYGRAEIHISFAAAAGTNPNLSSFSKTGKPTVWIVRTATSTWQLYVKKSENWDIITVTDIISPISTVAITWKCQNATSVPAGFVTATQMASYYNVDSTNGGTSGSNNLVTSGALYFTTTIANQTADKFQWIVKSGTSAADFTLTDRVASLLSAKFNIDALTTFKNSASNGTSTVINGGAIKANTITADKIKVDSLQAISAKIGGFTIDNNNIASGTWGTSGSVMMCTGTDGAKSIGGSGTISGWCFTAGAKFGVTKTGSLYASDITVNGGKIDLNASSVTTAASSTTAYFRTAYSSSCYARISSGKDCSEIKIVDGNSKIFLSAESGGAFIQSYKGDELKLHYYDGYLRADEIQAKTKLTCQSFSASGSATITGNITTSGKLTATGNFELRTSGNASNLILHDDYAKYCYIRYSGARLWFLPATDSGGFELGHSASLDANTGTFYATAWGSNSSKRYKENITELTESVADRLLKIKTYHFDYKKDYGGKDMYGVIAEEVEQVHKNAVLYRNGEPDAVDYTRFIPLLIKKVQMQDKKLKYLENVVAHLIGIAMNPEQVEVEKVRK